MFRTLRSRYALLSLVTPTAMLGQLLGQARKLVQQMPGKRFEAEHPPLPVLPGLLVLPVLQVATRQLPGEARTGRMGAHAATPQQAPAAITAAACAPSSTKA